MTAPRCHDVIVPPGHTIVNVAVRAAWKGTVPGRVWLAVDADTGEQLHGPFHPDGPARRFQLRCEKDVQIRRTRRLLDAQGSWTVGSR